MQTKTEKYVDKGPGFAMTERQPRLVEAAPEPKKRLAPEDEVYVFSTAPVNCGDGKPIPGGQFVKVKAKRIRKLESAARQKRGHLNVMPYGWTPKELDI